MGGGTGSTETTEPSYTITIVDSDSNTASIVGNTYNVYQVATFHAGAVAEQDTEGSGEGGDSTNSETTTETAYVETDIKLTENFNSLTDELEALEAAARAVAADDGSDEEETASLQAAEDAAAEAFAKAAAAVVNSSSSITATATIGSSGDGESTGSESGGITSTESTDGTVTYSNNSCTVSELGYNLIMESSHGSDNAYLSTQYILVVVDGSLTTYQVEVKTSQPTVQKKIVSEHHGSGSTANDENVLEDADTVAIGDTVTYQIDSTIPEYDPSLKSGSDDADGEDDGEDDGEQDDGDDQDDGETASRTITYKLVDTMSKGLTFSYDANSNNTSSVKVEVAASESGTYTVLTNTEEKTSYTVTVEKLKDSNNQETGETQITITITDVDTLIDYADGCVRVTLTATLNENANYGTTGNPNSVHLEYSNDYYGDSSSTPSTYTTTEDTVITYTGELTILKVAAGESTTGTETDDGDDQDDGDDDGDDQSDGEEGTEDTNTYLEGAQFELRTSQDAEDTDGNSTAISFVEIKDTNGNVTDYRVATEEEIKAASESSGDSGDGSETTVTTTLTTGSDGKIHIIGLDTGTYYLQETQAPSGYDLDSTVYKVEVKVYGNDTSNAIADNKLGEAVDSDKATGEEGREQLVSEYTDTKSGTDANESIAESYTVTWKVTVYATGDSQNQEEQGNSIITIINTAGETLPGTGGMGSTLFLIIGFALVVLAAIMLLLRTRRAENKNT